MDRPKKIANIIETYFSDANLLWDKTMQSYIKNNTDGLVPIEKLIKLQRMKPLQADSEEIKEAIKIYSLSKLKISDDHLSIGRIKPFILNKKEELDDWSIYVEGLDKPYQTEQQISDLFKKYVGHVSFVRIPEDRFGHTWFQGFCFVEFDHKDNVQKAINIMNTFSSEPSENEQITKLGLRVMSKHDWIKYRDEYLAQLNLTSSLVKQEWIKHDNEQKQKKRKTTSSNIPNTTTKKKDSFSKNTTEDTITYPKNIIIFVQNLHVKSSKTTIKTLLEQSGASIAFVKHKKKTDWCHVRMASSEDTDKIVAYFKDHLLVQESGTDTNGSSKEKTGSSLPAITVRAITGKEEELYWQDDPMRDKMVSS
ncbi:uncharacterized protein BX664DRAFT_334068 [Halteromyces radiatus]|uniref:uncharacterized protein n=1 Tax=Halteromyces radiatus TaxID=101107 RepID=UPI002220B180|nr:uncharacterized protein BX664DRAFT_334068 [Halteromyces radiatus]KAI8089847.1 hypothetical protein BX664DRAFT_334068 [Halteromyces radiatus]